MSNNDRLSVYDRVTNNIVADLERGIAAWSKPWSAKNCNPSMPVNAKTKRAYSGVNVLMLWATALHEGFASSQWLTFKQAQELGGCVRKGSKGTMIVYASQYVPEAERARAENEGREASAVPFLKSSYVFALEQIDGLESLYTVAEPLGERELNEAGERVIAASGADIRFGGDRAFYAPAADFIQLPPQPAFHEQINFYRTAFHELGHWTGHETRLARQYGKRFGDTAYAREELVAELSAAFVCASLGIQPTVRHADYLGSWLKVLKADNRAIFTAASAASKAADYILSRDAQPLALAA